MDGVARALQREREDEKKKKSSAGDSDKSDLV
jgi:hypothetical protein